MVPFGSLGVSVSGRVAASVPHFVSIICPLLCAQVVKNRRIRQHLLDQTWRCLCFLVLSLRLDCVYALPVARCPFAPLPPCPLAPLPLPLETVVEDERAAAEPETLTYRCLRSRNSLLVVKEIPLDIDVEKLVFTVSVFCFCFLLCAFAFALCPCWQVHGF